MPRWPTKPENWKPTDTTVAVPGVGEVASFATFDHSEPEGGRTWSDSLHNWVPNARTFWKVRIVFGRTEYATTYNQGSHYTAPPTAEDVLGCLALDASCVAFHTFEDFCGDLGYDTDSRSAEATYRACIDTMQALRRMFGEQYDAMQAWAAER